jgi:diaminopimelate decarboxylase
MNAFTLHDGVLHAESVPLDALARRYGTPCYVYSRAALESAYRAFAQAAAGRDALICYAMKANSNLAILNLFARMGAGFDIVSGGELRRVLSAGGNPRKVVFSGVGKSAAEMQAALTAGILCFNVESEAELERLSQAARAMKKTARVSLRVNPDVDAKTHPYISTGLAQNKFGIAHDRVMEAYRKAASLPGLDVVGIDCHIGSQLTEVAPFIEALDRVLELVDKLAAAGIRLSHLDLGGGLGIRYRREEPPSPGEYMDALFRRLGRRKLRVLFEPGRALVGNAGVLLTRVEYLKPASAKNAPHFAIVDAGMNDLMRPALYSAWHDIQPVTPRAGGKNGERKLRYDVVGPVCETADFLGKGRSLALQGGDLLAVFSAGAYGMAMSSNYNARPRPAEVMVDGAKTFLIRRRESVDSLFRGERRLP